jgi:predicted MFS family arabinose efflux permease
VARGTLETTALELTFIAGPPLALGLATGLSTRAPLFAGAVILLVATSAFAATATALHSVGDTGPLLGIWGLGSLLGGMIGARLHASSHDARAVTMLIALLAAGHAALILGSGSMPVLGGLLLVAGAAIAPTTGSIYALAGRAAPAGTKTEAFAWLLSASATGASIGVAAAGALSQTAGPQAAFALAGVAGALAVLIAIAGRRNLTPDLVREPLAWKAST